MITWNGYRGMFDRETSDFLFHIQCLPFQFVLSDDGRFLSSCQASGMPPMRMPTGIKTGKSSKSMSIAILDSLNRFFMVFLV